MAREEKTSFGRETFYVRLVGVDNARYTFEVSTRRTYRTGKRDALNKRVTRAAGKRGRRVSSNILPSLRIMNGPEHFPPSIAEQFGAICFDPLRSLPLALLPPAPACPLFHR